MEQGAVSARELRIRLGAYLRRVREGRTLLGTHRGGPVAELRPLAMDASFLATLLKLSGRRAVTLPASGEMPPFRPVRSRGRTLASAIRGGREDRL